MKKYIKIYRIDFIICIFLIFISFYVIKPFLQNGYFPTHDGEWAVVRLTDMYRQLKDLQLPPRYSGNLNFGYGYPLFNFAYPFPYYLGIVIYILGLGFVDSIKMLFALSVPLSAISMYFLSKTVWKSRLSGFISSLLYIYLPYRFVDLYVRGSIGESLSFIFFPLILLSLLQIRHKQYIRFYTLLFALTFACLIMTHNIMTVLFLPVIIVFFSINIFNKNKHALLFIGIGLMISLMLSAFFWLPALIEKNNILLSKIPIADRNLYFVNLSDLVIPNWGYGTPTELDKFTYNLGFPHIIAFLVIVVMNLYAFFNKSKTAVLNLSLIISVLIVIYLSMLFRFSESIWSFLPLISEINYPWTLLAPIGFLMSFLSGHLTVNKKSLILSFILVFFAALLYLPYAKPVLFINKGDNYYLTNDATTTSSSELMPLWVKNKPVKRFVNKVELLSNDGDIKNLSFNSKSIIFQPVINRDTNIRINTIFYPGWKAYADGERLTINYNNDYGLMTVLVPKATKQVTFIFTETPLRLIANFLTLLGVIFTFIFWFLFRFIKR